MKQLIFSMSIILLVMACNFDSNRDNVEGEIRAYDEAYLILKQMVGTNMEVLDTIMVVDGKFSFQLQPDIPIFIDLTRANGRILTSVWIENSDIKLSMHIDSIQNKSVKGSLSDDLYSQFLEKYKQSSPKRETFLKRHEARKNEDTELIEELSQTINEGYRKRIEFERQFIFDNNQSIISVYLANGFFVKRADLDALKQVLSNADESLHSSPYYQNLEKNYKLLQNVAIGQVAPDFTLNDPEGNPVSLSSFRGKYLLIDFWASWCGPCRKENPNVVKLYNKYKDKGFEILGVSLDRDKQGWIYAIEKDELTWTHVSDLKFWNSAAAELYAIKSVPYTILLDKEGIIIAKNLKREKLVNKLAELMD